MRWPRSMAAALLVAACASSPGASTGMTGLPSQQSAASATPPPASATPPAASAAPGLTFVMFGDSWPFGAHCNGCRPFPVLVSEGLGSATGKPITFVNLTTNGGTAEALAGQMASLPAIQQHIAAADVIVIATGGNDLGPAFEASAAGTCGGADDLDCFRAATATLRQAYGDMLAEIEAQRAGRPTAVRLVANSNEFLADPGLIALLGADFGKTSGVTVTRMLRDMACDVAESHHAACVDLGIALNGPDLLTPNDVNSQAAMQQVADAILAVGLAELQP